MTVMLHACCSVQCMWGIMCPGSNHKRNILTGSTFPRDRSCIVHIFKEQKSVN